MTLSIHVTCFFVVFSKRSYVTTSNCLKCLVSIVKSMINNGNWTEWSAIWSEIIRVIWNHKCDFRPKLHDPKFNCHFITSNNTFNSLSKYKNHLNKKSCQICQTMAFLSFIFLQCCWLVKTKPWNLIGCFGLLSHSHWLRKRCDLEQKIVRYGSNSHCWEPNRLQG